MVYFFYAHEAAEFGPFTPRQMRALADCGTILRTDLVWEEGIGRKVQADRVINLFPAAALIPEPDLATQGAMSAPEPAPEPAPAKAPDPPPRRPEPTPRAKRINRIRGGVILSQDGEQVKFFKKCEVCHEQDPSRTTATIRAGCTNIAYFCRKCRKGRKVELFGIA